MDQTGVRYRFGCLGGIRIRVDHLFGAATGSHCHFKIVPPGNRLAPTVIAKGRPASDRPLQPLDLFIRQRHGDPVAPVLPATDWPGRQGQAIAGEGQAVAGVRPWFEFLVSRCVESYLLGFSMCGTDHGASSSCRCFFCLQTRPQA